MFRLNRWLGVLAVLLCTSVALAQRPPGGAGGRPGGGFGFGGPGGPQSPLTLVAAESVQKELGLKDDQLAKVKALTEEFGKEMRSVFTGGGFGERPKEESDAEREKRREEMQTKMAAATKKVNETILPKLNETLDATQRERLQQIRLQAWGSIALLDAEIAKSLNLDKEQSSKLASISKEFGEKQAELFRPSRGDAEGDRARFQESFAKMRELNEARDKQLAEVLTADQREQLAKLKGKPFDVAQLRGGFGGFGGGRGGPGGGGANPGGRPQRRPATDDKKADEKKADEKKTDK